MTVSLRLVALALLAACKGAGDARATPAAASMDSGAATAPAASATPAATPAVTDPLVARADSGRIRGNPAAKVWLIVASDFQCPYCRMWHDSTDATIRREYIDNGKVRLAFINYPIGGHVNAIPAAEHAMCAAAQDRFWAMHDALFASQEKWERMSNPVPAFEEIAAKAGVDVAAMKACVSEHKMLPLIEADHEKASRAGVRATPSFFIGNQLMEGVQSTAEMRRVLDAALANAGAR